MSKRILVILFLAFVAVQCTTKSSNETIKEGSVIIQEQAEADTLKGSVKAYADKHLGGRTAITITYTSPAVRGRVIWGALVPFDSIWVTGAHMATTFESSTGIHFGETEIAKGKYALFTIPGKENWTIVLNKNWDQHLTDEYDKKDDVLRITVKPELVNENQERLMYSIDQTGEKKGFLIIRWEKIKIKIPIEAK